MDLITEQALLLTSPDCHLCPELLQFYRPWTTRSYGRNKSNFLRRRMCSTRMYPSGVDCSIAEPMSAGNDDPNYTKMTLARKLSWMATGILTLIIIAAVAAGPIMSRVEQPEYTITASDGSFEIRSYGPQIVAEVVVEGERKAAINQGFRLIADYIFGGNTQHVKIDMTSPVQQRQQKIDMTAPVTQQADAGAWKVNFIMPRGWTLATLPVPNDARVSLRSVPARQVAAVRFSGLASDATIKEKTAQLRQHIVEHGIVASGEPTLAFYNPPWTLPFLRRNEIMLEVMGSLEQLRQVVPTRA